MATRQARHQRRKSAEQAEIGVLPQCENPQRRAECAESLERFLVEYFPHSTGLSPFSTAHNRVIGRMDRCIRHGGRNLNAVFRGFAKTTITENSTIWATFYGYRSYVVVMGALFDQAKDMVDSIIREIETNELLQADFPEICLPFLALEGKAQRCRAQTHDGLPTYIGMSGATIILPTILQADGTPYPSSAGIIRASGLFPPRRGMKFKRPDGKNARPDFAILDDFQTDESAASPEQTAKLIKRIYKAVLNSAGHGEEMGCVINATPIEPNDGVEQLLDHQKHPSFMGERVPMVQQWAKRHEDWWLGKYAALRSAFDPADAASQEQAHAQANALYAAEQNLADDGCVVTWEHIALRPGELSAIQHAYNMLIDNGAEVFASECQMCPDHKRPEGIDPLTAPEIARRVNGFKRGAVPTEAVALTGGIDVHDDVLYWSLVAWTQQCQGWIFDYGTFPKQTSRSFSKRSAKQTIKKLYPGIPVEDAVRKALEELLPQLLPRLSTLPHKLGIDTNYRSPEVKHVCKVLGNPHVVPMRGVGIGANSTQVIEYERRKGWVFGNNWWIAAGDKPRLVSLDDYNWKTWLWQRWHTPITSEGSLSLWGKLGEDHQLFAEHQVAEVPTEEPGRKGLTKIIWKNSDRHDNHWLDTLKICAVGASMLGCQLGEHGPAPIKISRRQRALQAAQSQGLLTEE